MVAAGKFTQSVLVLGAGLVAPASAVPPFNCVCPTGPGGTFCLGVASNTAGCCCGGGCCSSESGCCCKQKESRSAKPAPASCCHTPEQAESNHQAQIKSRTCEKTLASAEFIAVKPTDSAGGS